MKIAYIHNVEIELDSRTQKEINSLLCAEHKVYFCGWNKEKDSKNEKKSMFLRGKEYIYENICISVKKRAGIKKNLIPLLRYFARLYKWLKEHSDVDVIHACSLDTALVAHFFARKKIKVVYDIYDDYADCHVVGPKLYKYIKKLDARVIKKSDVVIICSEKRIEQLAATNNNTVVIHNTPDICNIKHDLFSIQKNNRKKIVYVGNLDDTRDIEKLMKITSKHDDWELNIGGDGNLSNIVNEYANKYDNVVYHGRMKYEDVLSLEAQCDVMPALYIPTLKNHKYAAPNKFYEALMLGKPIIMYENTGVDDLVIKYNTGLVSEYDEEHLEKVLVEIMDNLDFWKENSERIKKVYCDYFSWDVMEKRLMNIYKQIDSSK